MSTQPFRVFTKEWQKYKNNGDLGCKKSTGRFIVQPSDFVKQQPLPKRVGNFFLFFSVSPFKSFQGAQW